MMNNRSLAIRHDGVLTKTLCYLLMFLVAVIAIVPFIWIFLSSFKTNTELYVSAMSLPQEFSFKNYADAFSISKMHELYFNSIIISLFATVLSVIVFTMVAYVLARYRFPGSKIIFAIMMTSILIPANAMIQPIYTVIRQLGLYDTKPALILIYGAFGLPTALFVLKNYFGNLPKEMEEAAEIEGAGFFTVFWQIMLPMAKPAVACATTLIFIFSWNEFMFAHLMTATTRSRTLPVAMRYFASEFAFNNSALFAAVMMVVVPSVVVYAILQNQIMESMVAGAIKG